MQRHYTIYLATDLKSFPFNMFYKKNVLPIDLHELIELLQHYIEVYIFFMVSQVLVSKLKCWNGLHLLLIQPLSTIKSRQNSINTYL